MRDVVRMGGLELRFFETRESTGGSLDLFEMTVQPGAKVPVAHHHTTWDETVYGLSGTLAWRIDGRDVLLEPGQTLFIRRGVVHGFRNDSGAPATCLSVLSPGVLGPGYFHEMAALIAEDRPDPARLAATMLRHGLIPAPGA